MNPQAMQTGGWAPPTYVGALNALVSTSTGSVLVDAGIGAGVGYLLAPTAGRTAYTVAGALLGGLGGIFGLALLGVYAYAKR